MAEDLRRPLGLFLQGGGALGAWQAGALEVLSAAGLRFDAVMGYSIGAVNGAALALGRLPEALAHWRAVDGRALKFRPRLKPFGLFSLGPLQAFFGAERDDAVAKAALQAELTLISACPEERAPLNARFTPGGRDGWDAHLVEFAISSCAIPLVFAPVETIYRGRRVRLVDGGVPMARPLDFSPLARCADIVVLEMVRAEERGRHVLSPWRALDQGAREKNLQLVDEGLSGLIFGGNSPPRVFRVPPSRRLEPMMLDFRAAGIRGMLAQGGDDARSFLADSARCRVL